jgi:chemotaxis protein methyltransferase CheR
MKDSDCIHFLQWALPRMKMRWQGFRKVRGQVCKRIQRRIAEIGLISITDYRTYVQNNHEEWLLLNSLFRITISRFYRDRGVFDHLHRETLPRLAEMALARGDSSIVCWSIGCASGEEAYTLKIIWERSLRAQFTPLSLRIVATDSDGHMIERARDGIYTKTSLKELHPYMLENAFIRSGELYTLREELREGIEFIEQDIRTESPSGSFHLIMCRNLVFTYFEEDLQRSILQQLIQRLLPGGFLVIGIHESLPSGTYDLEPCKQTDRIYRKNSTEI